MKRRGSAMIFAIVMVVAMTTSIMVTLTVTTNALQAVRRQEDTIRARYALEGAMEQAVADHGKGTFSPPSTRNYTVNSLTCTLTITDNSSSIRRTLSIAGTITIRGRTFTENRVKGMRQKQSPFYYALFVDNLISMTQTLVTGSSGSNGDVYANGSINLSGSGSAINGELESTGSVTTTNTSVTGNTFSSAPAIAFPTVTATDYSTASGVTTIGSSITGYTFTTGVTGTQLLYAPSGLSIRGTFRNKGTIFVVGNVTVSGAITYFDSNSRLAVIATGNVSFNANPVVGYWFGQAGNAGSGTTNSRGAFIFKTFTTTGNVSVVNDPAIWNDVTEGPKMYLPGFYP